MKIHSNKRLSFLIKNNSSSQSSIQVGTALNKWVETFPHEKKFLQKFSKNLNRSNISKVCLSSKYNVRRKFLLVMLWGYGNSGVGAYRTKKITNQSNFDKKLKNVFELSRNSQNIDAFSYLSLNQIKGFGPAFASKFIYFCTPKQKSCAPIYDARVRNWLKKYAKKELPWARLAQASWHTNSYSAWCGWLQNQAEILGVSWDKLEYLIFDDSKQIQSNRKKR